MKVLWNEGQNVRNLKVINLSGCDRLTEVPDLSGSRQIEHINLHDCTRLVRIPSYFKDLDKLTSLDLGRCENLEFFPRISGNIEYLDLSWTAIKELPKASSTRGLFRLTTIKLSYCRRLASLPTSIYKSKSLKRLDLSFCRRFEHFPEILEPMEQLKFVSLSNTAVKEFPLSISNLTGLRHLDLTQTKIESIPASITQASRLSRLCIVE